MGTGASVENARTTVSSVIGNKPVDASDIKVINYKVVVHYVVIWCA